MYAIIATGGKQYKVSKGDVIRIEKLNAEAGDEVTFDQVLMISNDDNTVVGNPVIDKATVTAKVSRSGRGKKVIVFKYKAKKHYSKKQGHRQPYTEVVIDQING